MRRLFAYPELLRLYLMIAQVSLSVAGKGMAAVQPRDFSRAGQKCGKATLEGTCRCIVRKHDCGSQWCSSVDFQRHGSVQYQRSDEARSQRWSEVKEWLLGRAM
jgi:hypothetical protein